MIQAIISFLTGGAVKELRRAFEAAQSAETEEAKLKAQVYLAEVEAQTERAIAGGRIVTWMQALWAGVFLIYDAKLVVWDKVLGLGSTDPLSAELLAHQALIMGFLFGPPAIRRALGR